MRMIHTKPYSHNSYSILFFWGGAGLDVFSRYSFTGGNFYGFNYFFKEIPGLALKVYINRVLLKLEKSN